MKYGNYEVGNTTQLIFWAQNNWRPVWDRATSTVVALSPRIEDAKRVARALALLDAVGLEDTRGIYE